MILDLLRRKIFQNNRKKCLLMMLEIKIKVHAANLINGTD